MTIYYDQLYSINRQVGSVYGLPDEGLIKLLSQNVFPNKQACDLGCGDGRQAIYLASQGWHVLAIDNSKNALIRLKEKIKRHNLGNGIDLLREDLNVLNLEKEKYDLVICVNTIHEIGEKATKHIIQQAKKSTKILGVNYLSFFVFYEGTYTRENCYYPDKEAIIQMYGDWEIIRQDRKLFDEIHITPDSNWQAIVVKHMQEVSSFKKLVSP